MRKKKFLTIDEEMEKDLALLCDVAMRFSGMHMATVVANIANALNKDDDLFSLRDEDEEW